MQRVPCGLLKIQILMKLVASHRQRSTVDGQVGLHGQIQQPVMQVVQKHNHKFVHVPIQLLKTEDRTVHFLMEVRRLNIKQSLAQLVKVLALQTQWTQMVTGLLGAIGLNISRATPIVTNKNFKQEPVLTQVQQETVLTAQRLMAEIRPISN